MSRAGLQRPEPRARPRPAPPPAARPLWRAAGAPQRPQRRTAPASAAAAAPRGTQRAPLRSSPHRDPALPPLSAQPRAPLAGCEAAASVICLGAAGMEMPTLPETASRSPLLRGSHPTPGLCGGVIPVGALQIN